jgi:hypothetical protein
MGPRRAGAVTYEVIDGQAVLIDPDGVELITLNQVGTRIWEALDGRRGASELANDLLPSFMGVSRDQLERDTTAFLTELREAGLLDDTADT